MSFIRVLCFLLFRLLAKSSARHYKALSTKHISMMYMNDTDTAGRMTPMTASVTHGLRLPGDAVLHDAHYGHLVVSRIDIRLRY